MNLAPLLAAALAAAGCASLPSQGATLDFGGTTLEEEGATGVEVLHVPEASPLATAGVRPGDVLTALQGEPVADAGDLFRRVYLAGKESPLRLTVRSGDSVREIDVTPRGARRTLRIGIGIPFLFRIDEDGFTLLPVSAASVAWGPDRAGCVVASCLGYMDTPASWRADLVLFGFGAGYRTQEDPPPAEAPSPK